MASDPGTNASGSWLDAYLRRAKRTELLTRDEECELAARWAEHGDAEAMQHLVAANLRLVVKIALRYRAVLGSMEDLVQEGNIGLLNAVRRFDPARGTRLSTYASWWIRAYVLRFVVENFRLVKIGTTNGQRKLFYNLRRTQARLRARGVEPDAERVAAELGTSEALVADMDGRMGAADRSLDAPAWAEEGATPLVETLAADLTDPATDLEDRQFRSAVERKLEEFGDTLEGPDREVFRGRMASVKPLSYATLHERHGLARGRAQQIERRLREPLRRYLRRELGEAVDA